LGTILAYWRQLSPSERQELLERWLATSEAERPRLLSEVAAEAEAKHEELLRRHRQLGERLYEKELITREAIRRLRGEPQDVAPVEPDTIGDPLGAEAEANEEMPSGPAPPHKG